MHWGSSAVSQYVENILPGHLIGDLEVFLQSKPLYQQYINDFLGYWTLMSYHILDDAFHFNPMVMAECCDRQKSCSDPPFAQCEPFFGVF